VANLSLLSGSTILESIKGDATASITDLRQPNLQSPMHSTVPGPDDGHCFYSLESGAVQGVWDRDVLPWHVDMSMFKFCLGYGRQNSSLRWANGTVSYTYSINFSVGWCVSVVSTSLPFFVLHPSPVISPMCTPLSAYQCLPHHGGGFGRGCSMRSSALLPSSSCPSFLYDGIWWSSLQNILQLSVCASPIVVVFPSEG